MFHNCQSSVFNKSSLDSVNLRLIIRSLGTYIYFEGHCSKPNKDLITIKPKRCFFHIHVLDYINIFGKVRHSLAVCPQGKDNKIRLTA